MDRIPLPRRFPRRLLALALLAAFGGAQAQGEAPSSSIGIGAAGISGDRAQRALFGQYNGLRSSGGAALLGFEYRGHDDDTGITTRLEGSDLLGPTRELDLRWRRPGDWKLGATYSGSVRHEPNSASSGGDLKLERTRLGLALVKTLGPDLQLDITLSSENKEGSRLFGIGMTCPSPVAPGCAGSTGTETGWALLMIPEPVNAHHSQIEARLSYAVGKLRLSGGYYGSFYRNSFGSLTPNVPGVLNNALGTPLPLAAGLQDLLNQPVALPPDNQAHQFDVAGGYSFTPTTHLNFKLAHGQALQHQRFSDGGFGAGPAGIGDLGGRVDTTLGQASLSARPWAKVSLLAKLRYLEVDDRTPIAPYNIEGDTVYTNRRLPLQKIRGQLQGGYQFTSDLRGTLNIDHEAIDRGVFTASSAIAGLTALRQKTDETGLRAELRRRMNEDLSASVSLATSRRSGSNWLRDNSGLGVTEVVDANDPATGFDRGIFMPTLADRRRDTVRVSADWQPAESLALQFSVQTGRDHYETPSVYGLRHAGLDQFNVDANYALTERWNVNAFLSWSNETLRQARPDAAALDFDNRSSGAGLGVVGKPNSAIELGASLALVDDRSVYTQTLDATADGASAALLAATGGLPDIVFRQAVLKLYGRYQVNKQSEWRLDLWHQRSSWSDWTWGYNGVPFAYSDGTTVGQPLRQHVSFVGLRYIHRWP